MVNRYTLGAAIFSIFLLSIFGIRGAWSWLAESRTTESDRIAAIDRNTINGTEGNFSDRVQAVDSQDNVRVDGQNIDAAELVNSIETLTPLQEAGTYIQRQKRVERDAVVAQTEVDVVPLDDATALQGNTTNVQPEPIAAEPGTRTQPSATAPASPAIPALW